mmetsp:Transcript_10484/g.29328  ORF Transcript_10484/g.29328 Transcript_10484/m.29328 type:complete len:298 (+) Transcript_10484:80-973(+)
MILRSSSIKAASKRGGRLGKINSFSDSILSPAATRPAPPPPPSSTAFELAPAAASSSSVICTEFFAASTPSSIAAAASSSSSRVSSRIARSRSLNMPVPTGMGIPMMMHSLTPSMVSVRPCSAASNRWSVVFSNDASISTLSFIFAMPNRVIPSTSPLYVITSARSIECRASMDMPCAFIVSLISLMMQDRAASMPSVRSASMTWLVVVCVPLTPSTPMTACRLIPSTTRLYLPLPMSLMTALDTLGMPCTMTLGTAVRSVCRWKSARLYAAGPCAALAFALDSSSGGNTCSKLSPA